MVKIAHNIMFKYLMIFCLIILPSSVFSESEKIELSDEQLAGFKAAEERYKDNPAKMNIINQFKEKLGITDDPAANEPPPPPKHITTTQGSMDSANTAYARGDYSTALEQYKAMAAQGNPEANIYVGMMYEAGMGTEADKATAQAWYSRAAETQTDYNHSKLVNEKTVDSYSGNRITAEEMAKADIINQEINSEIARSRGEEPSEYLEIDFSDAETRSIVMGDFVVTPNLSHAAVAEPAPMQQKRPHSKKQQTRVILFSPQKNEFKHPKPVSHTEHHYPDKQVRDLN